MTGLEKILAQISLDTEQTCADIKNRSVQQCNAIINSALIEAENIKNKNIEKTKKIREDIIQRAESYAQLQKQSVMLSAKQEIISNALHNAHNYLINLPDDKYFSLVYDMIEKYSEAQSGELYLSKTDLQRLPADFAEKVSVRAKGPLTLSKEAVDIDGGFVLVYGGVDINCGFSAIFAAENERFVDEISAVLFSS